MPGTSEVIYNINANSQLLNQVLSYPVALNTKLQTTVHFLIKNKEHTTTYRAPRHLKCALRYITANNLQIGNGFKLCNNIS